MMKDLTHYFNSPPQTEKQSNGTKTPEDDFCETNIGKKVKKIKKSKKNISNDLNESNTVMKPSTKRKNLLAKKISSENNAGFELDVQSSKNSNPMLYSSSEFESNTALIEAEMNLDESVEIENIPRSISSARCRRNYEDANPDEEFLSLNEKTKKYKRKRKNSASENKPKKKDRKNVESCKLEMFSLENCNSENVEIVNSKIESSCVEISEKLVDTKENDVKEFVGIKLKKVKNPEKSDSYEINSEHKKIPLKKKKKSKILSDSDDIDEKEELKNYDKPIRKSKRKKKNKKEIDYSEEESFSSKSSYGKNGKLNEGCVSMGSETKISEGESKEILTDIKNDLEKPDTERRNSLFKYYNKIDKAEVFQNVLRNDKIKVEVIVHSPSDLKSRPCVSDSVNMCSKLSKRKSSKRQVLNGLDEIILLSSETLSGLDELSNHNGNDGCSDSVAELEMTSDSCTPSKKNTWRMRDSLSTSKSLPTADSGGSLSSCDDKTSKRVKKGLSKKISVDETVNVSPSVSNSFTSLKKCADDEDASVNDFEVISDDSMSDLGTPESTEYLGKKSEEATTRKSSEVFRDSIPKSVNGNFLQRKKSLDQIKSGPEGKSDKIKDVKNVSSKGQSNSKIGSSILNNSNKKSPSGADFMAKFLGMTPKEVPKPKIDPAVLEARQKFLESGVPDIIKQKSDNSQSEKVSASPAPFPKVSHVQQRNPHHMIWNLPAPSIVLQSSPSLNLSSLNLNWTSFMISPKCSLVISDAVNGDALPLTPVVDQKHHLKRLKKNTTLFDVGECWGAMKMKKAGFDAHDVWSEVYKPRKCSDFINNYYNIQKLKSWMESLKNKRVDLQDGNSSEADFADSDSEDKANSVSSTCIISGPNGCGKTSAVFAIANELGYKVFEVNASSNRNGKKILTDLSEATQSHQVEHSKALANFLKTENVTDKEKKRRKKKNNEVKQELASKKRSLILIEDADLLFDERDDGFIPAVATLAGSSKRPLVLIVNDLRMPHLSKLFAPNQLQLNFNRPSPAKLEMWLQIIALVNGMNFDANAACKLVQWSECDVRKSLLQLQFLVQSHLKTGKSWPGISDSPQWISSVSQSECEEDKREGNICKKKALIRRQLKSTMLLAQSLVTHDLLSTSSLDRMRNPCPFPCKVLPVASTSLLGSLDSSNKSKLSCDIADYLFGSVTTSVTTKLRSQSQARKTEQILMSALPPSVYCSHSAVFVDYLPTLRLLGRAETVRLALHTRRTNRFFNYLNGLGVNASDSCIKYMCDTFS